MEPYSTEDQQKTAFGKLDLYRFGVEQGEKPWVKHLPEAERQVEDAVRTVSSYVDGHLSREADCFRFWQEGPGFDR